MEPRAPSIQTILCLCWMDLGGSLWVGHCVLVCVVNICYFSVKSPRRYAIQTSSNNSEISCLPDSCMGHQWWCRRDKEQEWRIMLSFKTIFSITLYWETLWEVFRIWSWKPLTVNGTIFGMFITSAKATSKKKACLGILHFKSPSLDLSYHLTTSGFPVQWSSLNVSRSPRRFLDVPWLMSWWFA